MTKQELIEDCTLKHLGNNPNGTRQDIYDDAMDKWADQCSIELLQWINENSFERNEIGNWLSDHFPGISYNNEMLLELYHQKNN